MLRKIRFWSVTSTTQVTWEHQKQLSGNSQQKLKNKTREEVIDPDQKPNKGFISKKPRKQHSVKEEMTQPCLYQTKGSKTMWNLFRMTFQDAKLCFVPCIQT